jgi:hypothetical protein
MTDKTKIALLTTVANFDLYSKSSVYFPKGIKKYVIDGTNGMHGIHSILYMMQKLKGSGIEWLIMADEDVIFTKSELVFDIIEEMIQKDYTVCGVRDGGVLSHRIYNPFVINTFFSILKFSEIEKLWNASEVLNNQYILTNEFVDELKNVKGNYDKQSLFEPYYCFYFWLRRKNKKILFLEAKMLEDSISNSASYNNEVFFIHTWYARSYLKNKKHTKRINKILFGLKNNEVLDAKSDLPKIFKNRTFWLESKIKKIQRKILLKLK